MLSQDTHNVYSAVFHPSGDYVIAGTDHHMVQTKAPPPPFFRLLGSRLVGMAVLAGSYLRCGIAAVLHTVCLG